MLTLFQFHCIYQIVLSDEHKKYHNQHYFSLKAPLILGDIFVSYRGIVYSIIALKNLQNSSTIQNISVALNKLTCIRYKNRRVSFVLL